MSNPLAPVRSGIPVDDPISTGRMRLKALERFNERAFLLTQEARFSGKVKFEFSVGGAA